MKKLNNKGYMLVEIVIASAISLVIAYFLIDITIKMINKNNDYYIESSLLADKNVITKEIMDDINSLNLTKIESNANSIIFYYDGLEPKVLKKEGNSIIYGNYNKELNSNLDFNGNLEIENDETNKIIYINLEAYTNYSNENYGIDIAIKYDSDSTDVIIPNTYRYEEVFTLKNSEQNYTTSKSLSNFINNIISCEILTDNPGSGNNGSVECSIKDSNNINISVKDGNVIEEESTSCIDNTIRLEKNATEDKEYYCTSGTLSGINCVTKIGSTYGYEEIVCESGIWRYDYRKIYSCSSVGYSGDYNSYSYVGTNPVGTSCSGSSTKTIDITADCVTSVVANYTSTYSCESGYNLSGQKCYKCSNSSYVLDTNNDCVGTCVSNNYVYKVQVKYR